ncbi:TetR/AcrR family transcriptional regulator [Actinoplanes sp. TRM 88003]|uniref:TetR/AcrR family transcriptional regulator n=1 Tax=Paractinoplanes aksuensis TaxID=2939490 RepID=A0ABT1DKZ2_9ACTN|nr:TetR/AcrR family transcriptional regulator [Actinoplanes aksuensis]MCO8271470.1 TetR/AcrR family transcriptional regulator [Actinoplanes aksuensis]
MPDPELSTTPTPTTPPAPISPPADTPGRPYHHGQLRTALLEAAERTLRTQGASELSLRELARELGVSHAAPRRHFPDRQSLLDALAITGFHRLTIQLNAALATAPPDDFPARLKATVAAYVTFATQDAALLDLMFTTKHRPGATEVAAAAVPAFTQLQDLMLQGQSTAHLPAGNLEPSALVLFATMQGIATLINGAWVDPTLLETLTTTAVTQFLRGAAPHPA